MKPFRLPLLSIGRLVGLAIVSLALFCSTSSLATTPPTWKDTGFSVNAKDLTLRKVLEEFGAVYAVGLSIGIDANKTVGGKLQASSGTEFLDRLSVTHKFRWFVYNDVLYIVPRNDNIAVRMQVGEDAVQDAKGALQGVGLYDPRFGWGELPDEGVVLVSGPREYVNLAREILLPDGKKAAAAALIGKQIMVFRLKYASATDRTINTRGKNETIPGLKTILNGLLNPGAGSGSGGGNGAYNGRSPDQLTDGSGRVDIGSHKRSRTENNGPGGAREVGGSARAQSARVGRDDGNASDDIDLGDNGSDRKSSRSKRDDKPKIDADPTLNALIIYDDVAKRERYQELINQLDLEPQQIEIEALIIDINRGLLSDFGVEWGVQIGNVGVDINGSSNDRTNSQSGSSQSPAGLPIPGSTLLITNPARFYARIRALEGSNEGRVLAKPTVLTLENVAAVLDINNSRYIPLTGERVADLASITAGTMLRVLPRIIRNGNDVRIRLDVDIEDGSILDNTSGNNSNVARSTITTQAIVENQHTLLVGGYNNESRQRTENKIPILGDVPLVGGLFRNSTTSNNNRERLFLITPRLADNSYNVRAGGLSTAAQRFRKMAGNKGQSVNFKNLEEKKVDERPVVEEKIISMKTREPVNAARTEPASASNPVIVPAPVAPAPILIPAPSKTSVAAVSKPAAPENVAERQVPVAQVAVAAAPARVEPAAPVTNVALPKSAPAATAVVAAPAPTPTLAANAKPLPLPTSATPAVSTRQNATKIRARSGSNTDLALQL